jgi:hypothetical protein
MANTRSLSGNEMFHANPITEQKTGIFQVTVILFPSMHSWISQIVQRMIRERERSSMSQIRGKFGFVQTFPKSENDRETGLYHLHYIGVHDFVRFVLASALILRRETKAEDDAMKCNHWKALTSLSMSRDIFESTSDAFSGSDLYLHSPLIGAFQQNRKSANDVPGRCVRRRDNDEIQQDTFHRGINPLSPKSFRFLLVSGKSTAILAQAGKH